PCPAGAPTRQPHPVHVVRRDHRVGRERGHLLGYSRQQEDLRLRERGVRMTGASDAALSIKARDLNLWYGDFQALKMLNVDIREGQITSLIGPSGCGKTTLLRCFNRVNERYGYVK